MRALLFSLACLVPTSPQADAETAARCFPLVAESVYEYKGSFNNREFKDVYVVKSRMAGGKPLFWFHRDGNSLVGSPFFGLGAYRIADNALETVPLAWENKPDDVGVAGKLLPADLKEGSESVLQDGAMELWVAVRGREEVQVPAGTYKDCVRIDAEQRWPKKNKVYKGSAWLAPGVGCVKRVNFTGRVDELVSVKIPGR